MCRRIKKNREIQRKEYLPIESNLQVPQVKGKVVPVIKHHAMKAYWGSGGIAPLIIDFGTGYR
jgi:hypothetical protein